ncbi:flagellar biosynthetic protein FliR [Paracoccus aurantiacus]|uniref:Flagellar biosynthetic protein FliR n=1 Tax=Paracoccus aurantiacus TaxID=2599412 RepID=A0A5C6S2H3_9RHOB|nr:flagellar biosynthetic protein FliR [Paracoccus aurantiacus]TXB68060.1 flagellar biosynthetic protein FliR [Paracoccus aurantiacus]
MALTSALPPDLTAMLMPLLLAYLRVQAAVLVFPVFSERVVSVRIRITIAMLLAPVAAVMSNMQTLPAETEGIMLFAPLALREMLAGFLIALPARIMASALHVASSAIGATASLSQLIGTGTEAAPHPIGNLMHMAGLALLMAMGLPILLVDLIAQSYAAFPAGQFQISGDQVGGMVGLVSRSFVLALAVASPFILGGLLYQVLTGIVNRVMPALPVVFIGAPAIIMLALVALAVLSPLILSGWADAVFLHALPD